jgi:hypothetical protein
VGGWLDVRTAIDDDDLLTIGFRWPKFMTKPKGQKLQQRIWEETRGVLEGYAPEVGAVYGSLVGAEKTLEK